MEPIVDFVFTEYTLPPVPHLQVHFHTNPMHPSAEAYKKSDNDKLAFLLTAFALVSNSSKGYGAFYLLKNYWIGLLLLFLTYPFIRNSI